MIQGFARIYILAGCGGIILGVLIDTIVKSISGTPWQGDNSKEIILPMFMVLFACTAAKQECRASHLKIVSRDLVIGAFVVSGLGALSLQRAFWNWWEPVQLGVSFLALLLPQLVTNWLFDTGPLGSTENQSRDADAKK